MTTTAATRHCGGCDEDKSLAEFPWRNKARGLLAYRCKPCAAASARASRARDIERYREKDREYHHAHKVVRNARRNAQWHARPVDDRRSDHYRKSFGISTEDYERLSDSQGHVCAICGNPERLVRRGKVMPLSVDHDHATGVVRGLLCAACNTGIARFGDSADLLLAAIAYLSTREVF